MKRFNHKIWNGFNDWAIVVAPNSERIERVWNNGFAVELKSSEKFFGKTEITIHNRNDDSVWEDDGNFVWGDPFIFWDKNYNPIAYSSDQIYDILSEISVKLAKAVKVILS